MASDIQKICGALGTEIGSVAVRIGSNGGDDSRTDIERRIFATEVVNPRLRRLFRKQGLRIPFLIPRGSLKTFPKEIEMFVKGGHACACYHLRGNPIGMKPAQKTRAVLRL